MRHDINILGAALLTAMLMAACGSEEDPVLDYTDPTYNFIPADSAKDEISELRRQFYAETGSYLLFNDTLQCRYTGVDVNGTPRYFIEKLDINYTVGSTSYESTSYTYSNLATDERKKEAVEYLRTYILPHFSASLRPFSYFLTSKIIYKNTSGDVNDKVYAASGQRAVVLACSTLPSLRTEAQKQQLVSRQLNVVISKLATDHSDSFSDFAEVSASYYGSDIESVSGMTTTQLLRSKGFLSSGNSSIYYPSLSDDISAYTSLVMNYTDERITKVYASYPLVIEKARLFKQDLTNIGFIF